MTTTVAERIASAEAAQLAILQAIETDEDVVEYTVDGQTYKRDPAGALEAIERVLRFLYKQRSMNASGRRSLARFGRSL